MPVHDWTRVDPGNFHDFHQRWIISLCDVLNGGLLPSEYYALSEQRAGFVRPDAITLESVDGSATSLGLRDVETAGGLALQDAPPKVRFTSELDDAVFYAQAADHVTVRHATRDRVVAFPEIVSIGNKKLRAEVDAFRSKLFHALWKGCHFLMVDIHRPGKLDPEGFHVACWEGDCGACVVTEAEP